MKVRRTFPFPREDVFAAWTDPDALMRWFGGSSTKVLSAAVDLRVGGAYRLTVQGGTEVAAVEGTYQQVEPPSRLVFTWRWDRPELEGGRESLVTVDLHHRDGATEVVVTHDGLEGEASVTFHERGWTASLEALAQVLAHVE